MNPSGPCFVSSRKGYFAFEGQIKSESFCKLLAYVNNFYESRTVYDAQGLKWRAIQAESHKFNRGFWTKFLANTVYNPRITVSITWGEPKSYNFQELQDIYSKAVDKDDDILTQFVEANELKQRIASAKSFQELVEIYNWMKTDHTDEG